MRRLRFHNGRSTSAVADECAEPAAEPPRERQRLLPAEASAPAEVDRRQREPTGAGHHARRGERPSPTPGVHSVISMWSTSLIGPDLGVAQERRADTAMLVASRTGSPPRRASTRHGPRSARRSSTPRSGDAEMSMATSSRDTLGGSGLDGLATQLRGSGLGRDDVDHHAGATLEARRRDQLRPQVHVPVERAVVVMRCGVEADVVRHVAVRVAQHLDGVADGSTDRRQRLVAGVGEVQFVVARDDEQLVRSAAPVRADARRRRRWRTGSARPRRARPRSSRTGCNHLRSG